MDRIAEFERIEEYGFECVAGPLKNCQDWMDLEKTLANQLTRADRCVDLLNSVMPDIEFEWPGSTISTILAVIKELRLQL